MRITDASQAAELLEQLLIELLRLEWGKELSEEALHDIVTAAEFLESWAGEILVCLPSQL